MQKGAVRREQERRRVQNINQQSREIKGRNTNRQNQEIRDRSINRQNREIKEKRVATKRRHRRRERKNQRENETCDWDCAEFWCMCMLSWYAGHGHDHFVKFVHCDGVFDFL